MEAEAGMIIITEAGSSRRLSVQMYCCIIMGVDHGGDAGDKYPRIWSKGDAIVQIVPLRFRSYRYKKERSVAFKIC